MKLKHDREKRDTDALKHKPSIYNKGFFIVAVSNVELKSVTKR